MLSVSVFYLKPRAERGGQYEARVTKVFSVPFQARGVRLRSCLLAMVAVVAVVLVLALHCYGAIED